MTTCPNCHRSSCPTPADDDFRAKHDCAMAQVQSLKNRRAEELLGFRQWLMAFERAAVELAALRAERDDTLAARDAAILHMHEAQEQLAAVVAQRDEARAETERLRRLTKQEADELAVVRRESRRIAEDKDAVGAEIRRLHAEYDAAIESASEEILEANGQIIAAHLALSEGGAPGDAAMGLAERIRAALPPTEKP